MKRKRCRYCKRLFTPDPRVGDHQVTCDDPHCKKAHKADDDEDKLFKTLFRRGKSVDPIDIFMCFNAKYNK